MNLLKVTILFPYIILNLLIAQVNTEAMREHDRSIGIKHNMSLDFSYFSGDAEIFQLIGFYKLSYLTKSNLYGFISSQYNRAYQKNSQDFENRGFIHIRTAKPIKNNIDIESFLQKELNHFINLKNRELIGLGFRINQYDKLFFGLGAMYEIEQYNTIYKESKFFKSTNYINHKISLFTSLEFNNVIYYQFKVSEPSDYRILWDGNISFQMADNFSFHINTHLRYDTSGESYFEISNGIGLQF